ncbi:MAG: hypothetical protein FVQ82_10555 [Planctomycetes bacterium]|nr:hypothetical protein [Planctomycetota bacterium]
MDKLLEPGTLTLLLIFGLPIVAVVGYFWYRIEKVRSDNNLKRRMVDSGMSIEDIERVLNAGSKEDDDE